MVSRPTTDAFIGRRALGSEERRGAVLSGAGLTGAGWQIKSQLRKAGR
jgi:hypothetical protein